MRAEKFFWPQVKVLWHQLKLGVPIGLSVFFEVSSFTLMAIFIARIGTIDVAAHQIVGNITATMYQIPLSLAIAVSVLVSQCLGAGYKDKAYEITIRTLKVAVTIALVGVTLLYIFRSQIVGLYTLDVPVKTLATSLLIFGIIYHVTDACQTVSGFALRGYRVTFAPMLIYGILLWAVGLGGGYWAGFHGEAIGGPYGAAGFWGATAIGLVLAGLCLAAMAVWVARTRMLEDRASAHKATA
ncbi:MAG: MATE family efflux transporter [Sutterellaceae bacterium]|nr:MATE family efflux transporter [Sutterellaceae bacterium]